MAKEDPSKLVLVEKRGSTTIITINRPHKRNCVNGPTARALYQAFLEFNDDPKASVAILTGAGGNFCAGADLAAIQNQDESNPMSNEWPDTLPGPIGPMGPTRMTLSKPVIAAISGFAVAGGIELALWCDIRIVDPTATLGVYCRLRGVPLIDGGTVRLPQVVGRGVAMDLMLTGRAVKAQEALKIQLATCYPPSYETVNETPALEQALALAESLAKHPQTCMRNDRLSSHFANPIREAMLKEYELGLDTLNSGEFMEEEFRKKQSSLNSLLDASVIACFENDSIPILLTLPNSDLASVKEAFICPPVKNILTTTEIDKAIVAGLDHLPEISLPTDTSTETSAPTAVQGIDQPLLDQRFQIGFSKQWGHSIELNKGSNNNSVGPKKVESGTFILQKDEMPYASVIQDDWKGKLCEECFRALPSDKEKIVESPIYPGGGNDSTKSNSRNNDEASKFCSQECLKVAWKSWLGYECKYSEELSVLKQQTQLALRIYWKSTRQSISLSSLSSNSTGSKYASASSSSSSSQSPCDINSVTSALPNLSISLNAQSARLTSSDGSNIHLSQLCHNFKQLDTSIRMSYLMTGYYLEQLLGLPEGSALELAYLQSLVKFNSFAVKARISERAEDDDPTLQVNDFSIGSALYLLTSMFNHSCAPNAMVVFGGCGKNSGEVMQTKSNNNSSSSNTEESDPRLINVIINRTLKIDPDHPVQVEISYGPQGGRMATKERKEYAEAVLQKIFKCPKNGYACRPMTEADEKCPTCGTAVDMAERNKIFQLIARLMRESQDPSLTTAKRMTLLKTLEGAQSKIFVDTYVLYGNTCDQLAMVYAQTGDLSKSIEWCKKSLKVVVVHFPHDSIEVAQETLKLAGLLFNKYAK
ncbi:Enoyl-CoA hydratase [Haplosporangium sp. Z 27]|nr:Enoyl-CoA hydratase [Haplosporangium sp. Z 27]